jgi:transposase-like protein
MAEGEKEDTAICAAFLGHLKERGIEGVRSFVSDKSLGLVESLVQFYPAALRGAFLFATCGRRCRRARRKKWRRC